MHLRTDGVTGGGRGAWITSVNCPEAPGIIFCRIKILMVSIRLSVLSYHLPSGAAGLEGRVLHIARVVYILAPEN